MAIARARMSALGKCSCKRSRSSCIQSVRVSARGRVCVYRGNRTTSSVGERICLRACEHACACVHAP
eukprot:1300478-Pleurochrysis_carterae.AAC.1